MSSQANKTVYEKLIQRILYVYFNRGKCKHVVIYMLCSSVSVCLLLTLNVYIPYCYYYY